MIAKLSGQITWRDVVFSVKTFAAAMAALYIAFRLDLSQPSWSMTTAYVVAQPFAGMVLARSLYRVIGTVVGAAVSVTFVALFSNAPALFCLAIALWIGLGTAFTIYMRDAPIAYVGMLSGYSAAIIGLSAALAPETAFDFAVARCLEISLGICCATLMHHVVFPRRAGPALNSALDAILPTLARWASDALRGKENEASGLADRGKIINAVVAVDSLRTFAVLDTPALRAIDPVVRQFEGTVLSLLALLMAVYDRFALLRKDRPAIAAEIAPLLERAAQHMTTSSNALTADDAKRESTDENALANDIAAHVPPTAALRSDPSSFLVRSILLRLMDTLALWRDAIQLRAHITAGKYVSMGPAPSFRPYRDPVGAAIGGLVSAIAVIGASVFWIFSAWPNGPTAVTFAGIICSITASRDNAAAASMLFFKMGLVGAVVALVYVFAILPALSTFTALVIALAPFYLICGVLLANTAGVPMTMPMIFVGSGLMALTNSMTYNLADFANNMLGYFVGIGMGAIALRLLRPLSTEWTINRLLRGVMSDLAEVAHSPAMGRAAFESRMFDRTNALFARLDPMNDEQRATLQGSLASLRIGLNLLALHDMQSDLPSQARSLVVSNLSDLQSYFAQLARGRDVNFPAGRMQTASQNMLHLADDPTLTRASEAIYSVTMMLQQHADFFHPRASNPPVPSLRPVTP